MVALNVLGAVIVGSSDPASDSVVEWILAAGLLVLIGFAFWASVLRLHDISLSGWWAVLLVVPLANLLVVGALLRKGDEGENRFGLPPK